MTEQTEDYDKLRRHFQGGVPNELVEQALFCNVVYESKPKPRKKRCKIPIHPITRKAINNNQAKNLVSLSAAIKGHIANPKSLGLGVALLPGCGVGCVDLDNCRDKETGQLSNFAQAVVDFVPNALVETSYSGTGLHVWGKFELPNGRGCVRYSSSERSYEAYTHSRYIHITANLYRPLQGDTADIQPLVDRVIKETRPDVLCGSVSGGRGPLNHGEKISFSDADWDCAEGYLISPWTQKQFDTCPHDPSLGDFILCKEALRCLGQRPTSAMRGWFSVLLYRYREHHGNNPDKALRLDYLQSTVSRAVNELDAYAEKNNKPWVTA